MKRIVATFALACLALPSLAQRRAWSDHGPWFATDGGSSDPGAHWASENNPVWLSVDLSYSGFLRWAYDSWTQDPLVETKHVTWDAGDCFLVYPGARSSIRFERLREGIQDFEKIRILRKAKVATPALEAALEKLTYQKAQEG